MPFSPTTFNNSAPPPISAAEMNKLGGGVQAATALAESLDGRLKLGVRAATTANVSLSGTQTIDGVALLAGERVLVKDQTTTSQNGIWIVAAGAWARAADADAVAEILPGMLVHVAEGNDNLDSFWFLTNDASPTPGTTPQSFWPLPRDGLAPLGRAEVPVSSATTLTASAFGRRHVCSGTTSDYAVTLPSATGNGGKHLEVRMASGLTVIVTLTGASGQLIDGQNTRAMWAQESVRLYCDGTGWTKVQGRSRPFVCRIRQTSTQSIASNTFAPVTMEVTDYDSLSMADLTNDRIAVKRASLYEAKAQASFPASSAPIVRAWVLIQANAATDVALGEAGAADQATVPSARTAVARNFAAGDLLRVLAFQVNTTATSRSTQVTNESTQAHLSLVEVPQW